MLQEQRLYFRFLQYSNNTALTPSVVFVFNFFPKINLKANKHDKNKIKHLLNHFFFSSRIKLIYIVFI